MQALSDEGTYGTLKIKQRRTKETLEKEFELTLKKGQ
jgi:hypothetical protein